MIPTSVVTFHYWVVVSFFSCSPLPGGRFPFWRSYFSNGLVQPPTSINSTVWIVYLFHLMPHLRLETVFFVGYFWSDDGPTSCCTEDQSVVYLYRKKELGFNSDNNWAVIKTIVTFHRHPPVHRGLRDADHVRWNGLGTCAFPKVGAIRGTPKPKIELSNKTMLLRAVVKR